MCTAVSEKNINQGTKYRNAQLRYTQIVYCTLWEECKQTKCPHTEVEGKGLQLWYAITVQQKKKLIYQVIRANTYNFTLFGQYGK